jgi:two-component system, response regulator YesN
MLYKVFLVEDEIVTREGIRDSVNWKSAGFEFCGEAPDGEIALPLIESCQPDLVITDIKMPFMDGLQLSKILREHMPWIKIIILSGHDEFQYAQTAIQLGVYEYLLKPVSVSDLDKVLQRAVDALDRERLERENLKRLRQQLDDNLALLRDKFLRRLVLGGFSSAEAIDQSGQLGLNLLANYYLVVVIQIELTEKNSSPAYQDYQRVERIISTLVGSNREAFLVQKDMEELLLLIKGDSSEQLVQEAAFLVELIQKEAETQTPCSLRIGSGGPVQRLGDIHNSFAGALASLSLPVDGVWSQPSDDGAVPSGRVKLDQAALEHYLKSGAAQDFDPFYDLQLQSISQAASRSPLVKHYLFMDLLLTTAQIVSDLGGNVDQVLPELHEIEKLLARVKTSDEIREEIRRIILHLLAYRDSRVDNQQARLIHQAVTYIHKNFSDPDLSLSQVAASVSLSPSHISVLFRQEMGATYRDYLTRVRIAHAKELLRTTNLLCAEVAYQCGYSDPHYFSHIFKKNTGMSPQQFRLHPKDRKFQVIP